MTKPRYRLAVDTALDAASFITLEGNAAHYLTQVVRLGVGDVVGLFNRTQGEWCGRIVELRKRAVVLQVESLLRAPATHNMQLTVCFAPIKGGRLETIIEKATELGAQHLRPVLTARTIVDKVNLDRANAIAREAAEQCERIDWPEIHAPVKLAKLLGEWPADMPLIYGDETGASASIAALIAAPDLQQKSWGILAGPEGGFTADELALLARVPAARGVGLGPRILRADTAIITLCALTLAAWGDWHEPPRPFY